MHFQEPPHEQAKLVTVISGKILDVFLDLRMKSPTYGKVGSVELGAKDGTSLYLPIGIAHGFLALQHETIVAYAVSSGYDEEFDKGILWSSIPYAWPTKDPVISDRDLSLPSLKNYLSPF